MRFLLFALVSLTLTASGCSSGSDAPAAPNNAPETTQSTDGITEVVCFIFSLFNPDCFDLDPLVPPPEATPATTPDPVAFIVEATSVALKSVRMSWEPTNLVGDPTVYTVWATMFPAEPWEETALTVQIPPGVLFWQLELPAEGVWYLRMTVEVAGVPSDWSGTHVVELL
jgi:hypothetical protein